MKVEILEVGDLKTNCYLLSINNKVVIIDPGDDFPRIKKAIGDRKVVGVLVTHFHGDHIGALEEVLSYYDVDLNKVKDNNFKYKTIETPGHTMESRTYYFEKEKMMFVGDFIFYNSIGRTDLGGSDKLMQQSLDNISKYPKDTIIYPGHGPKTSLEKEIQNFRYYY